jgi:hypothetical protein
VISNREGDVIIQWFLRGISDCDDTLGEQRIKDILNEEGLRSRWLRENPRSDPAKWDEAVNHPDSLVWHITKFNRKGFPLWADKPFCERSPFLSLSSGTVEPDYGARKNRKYPAWYTAISFATSNWQCDGWVFHGYTSVLGRPALPLLEFSEEVRDLHQHDFFNRYHPEGEVVAKILVPPVRLKQAFRVTSEKLWEWYDGLESLPEWDADEDSLQLLERLSDGDVVPGSAYRAPEEFSNVRDLI